MNGWLVLRLKNWCGYLCTVHAHLSSSLGRRTDIFLEHRRDGLSGTLPGACIDQERYKREEEGQEDEGLIGELQRAFSTGGSICPA